MRAIKLTVMILIAAALCAAAVFMNKKPVFRVGASYTFYTGSNSSNCNIIEAGNMAPLIVLTLKDISGEATTYPELDVETFLSGVDGRILFTEELSDSVNYYCSADLPYSVELYGETVNLHVCVKENGVTVASPVIFGGY